MRVTQITFDESGKVHLVVEIPDTEAFLTTETPRMPRILFRMFPYLASQRCYNDLHVSFRREASNTEIPHLFEHLLLEVQKQVRRGIVNPGPMSGETQWNWTMDPRGLFHVTVGYDNEIVALASIRLCERIMISLDSRTNAVIDVDREIKRLRELAKASRRFIAPRRASEEDFEADLKEDTVISVPPGESDPEIIEPEGVIGKSSRSRAKSPASSTGRFVSAGSLQG
jgi:hypothetical protein